MDNIQRVTILPTKPQIESEQKPSNPARDAQNFVGEVILVLIKPADLHNLGGAKLTQRLSNASPSFPAARLYRDLVMGWPHSHPHAPTFCSPLPSIGVVICAGATNVLNDQCTE
jgi:hypothetical protein